jgi:hypothetical protein
MLVHGVVSAGARTPVMARSTSRRLRHPISHHIRAGTARPAANGFPSASILCRTTASFLASATLALRMPARLARRAAQLFKAEPFTGFVRMTFAAS